MNGYPKITQSRIIILVYPGLYKSGHLIPTCPGICKSRHVIPTYSWLSQSTFSIILYRPGISRVVLTCPGCRFPDVRVFSDVRFSRRVTVGGARLSPGQNLKSVESLACSCAGSWRIIARTYASEPQRRVRDFCLSLSELSEL